MLTGFDLAQRSRQSTIKPLSMLIISMLYLYFKFGFGVLLGKPGGRPNVYNGGISLYYKNSMLRKKYVSPSILQDTLLP